VEYFSDSFGKRGVKTMMYDLNWNPAGWTLDAHQGTARVIQKPECFDEMIRIAAVLCAEFNHVRVDFHLVRDRVYFGEMTFTSASGLEHFEPEAWNLKLGDMIKLPID
jgi:hypothetical protein